MDSREAFEKWVNAAVMVANAESMADEEVIPTWPVFCVERSPELYPELTVGAVRAWQASRQAIECEPVAWLISKGEEKEVMFDSEYDRNDRNHDEKRGWKYDPLFTHANSDEWIKCSDRMPDVRCLAFTPSDHEEVRYRIVPKRILKALSEATHWMPLPEPPKQEQGQ